LATVAWAPAEINCADSLREQLSAPRGDGRTWAKALALAKGGFNKNFGRSFVVMADLTAIALTQKNSSPVGMKNSVSMSRQSRR